MIVFAEMSTTMWIVILALAMLPILSGSKHRCERRGRFRIGGMLVALIGVGGVLLFALGTQRRVVIESGDTWTYAYQTNPLQFDADISILTLFLMGAAVLAFLALGKKLGWGTIFVIPVALMLLFFVGSFRASRQDNLQANTLPSVDSKNTTAADPTLEALWDKLTKSRINLDAEASEPVAEPTDEKIKDTVKDTFGLGDEGNLPPKWVVTPPKQVGQVYRIGVASGPWSTEEDCRRQLVENMLPEAVAKRIEYLAPSRVGRKVSVADPALLGIGPDYILREIGRDEFTGTVDSSMGEMKNVHVLLEFDKNVDGYLLDSWLRHERQTRFASVGKVAALSLTGLAAIYGLLRFDTWSKGYYTRQLLVGGTLAIIALAVFLLRVS